MKATDKILKVGAVSPRIRLGDVAYNVKQCIKEARRAAEMGTKLLECLNSVGTNVVSDILYFKVGGLPFLGGKLNAQEKETVLTWVNNVVANIK